MDLKEMLGEELYSQVMEKAGDHKIAVVSDGNWIPKEKFNEKISEVKTLRDELAERDTQLDDLSKKAGDSDTLKEQIDALKEANRQKTEEFERQLQQQTFNYKLENELLKAEVHNPKAVKALLDTEAIKLDGDNLMGLTDQLAKLKETDGYLFKSNEPPSGYKPGPNQKGNQPKEKTLADIGRQRALERHGQKEEN